MQCRGICPTPIFCRLSCGGAVYWPWDLHFTPFARSIEAASTGGSIPYVTLHGCRQHHQTASLLAHSQLGSLQERDGMSTFTPCAEVSSCETTRPRVPRFFLTQRLMARMLGIGVFGFYGWAESAALLVVVGRC